jgi:hypothetical protein
MTNLPNKPDARAAVMAATLAVPARLLTALTGDELILFSYLVRLADRAGDGWFQAPWQRLELFVGLPPRKQSTLIGRLVRRGILEVERRGQGARRWLRINWDGAAALVQEAKCRRPSLPVKPG